MKILTITASFAPRSASPAIRTVNLTKHFAQLGYSVRVITYDETTLTLFSPPDPALSSRVPAEVEVIRVPPGPLRKRLVRRKKTGRNSLDEWKERMRRSPITSLFIPDPHVDAIVNFLREGAHQIEDFGPDIVLTHGYPFSMHIVGSILKRRYPHILWIADYGDPWSGNPVSELPQPHWRRWLDLYVERTILKVVDWVTVTTTATKKLYESLFPFLKGRISVVPMGFDPEEAENVIPLPRPSGEERRIWLVYTGRLYLKARDPKPFIEAVSLLAHQDPKIKDRLRVFLIGEVESSIKALIKKFSVQHIFCFVSWVPTHESIAWMKTADYLILFGNKGGIQIPGKVYQYLASGKPIFAIIIDENDPTAEIISNNPMSIIVKNDSMQILEQLKIIISHGRTEGFLERSIKNSPYAWPNIVEGFAKVLEELVNKKKQ